MDFQDVREPNILLVPSNSFFLFWKLDVISKIKNHAQIFFPVFKLLNNLKCIKKEIIEKIVSL